MRCTVSHHRPALLLLLTTLGACARRPPQGPAVQPAAHASTVTVPPAPAVTDAPAPAVTVPPAPAVTDAPATPDAVLLRRLADGGEALAAHIDRAHGVVLVTFLEAPPSGRSGATRSSRRLCDTPDREAIVRARLREVVAQAADDDLRCDGDECLVPGMEYQPSYRVRFGRGDDGARTVLGVSQQSEAALGEPWLTQARAYVERAFAEARARPCAR
jgi:hypothetical protein